MKNQINFRSLGLVALLTTLTTLGCTEKQDLEIWVVKEKMPLYKTYIKDKLEIKTVLTKGDICIPGKTVITKAFQYREVLCLKKGYGWIVDDYFQKIKSIESIGSD